MLWIIYLVSTNACAAALRSKAYSLVTAVALGILVTGGEGFVVDVRVPFPSKQPKMSSFVRTVPSVTVCRSSALPLDSDEEFEDEDVIRLRSLTVAQLRQQLRVSGLPVGGRKAELIDRLLQERRRRDEPFSSTAKANNKDDEIKDDGTQRILPNGEIFEDVSAYVEEQTPPPESESVESTDEVWGDEARITNRMEVQDSPVIDELVRTLVEYEPRKGFSYDDGANSAAENTHNNNNSTKLQAYVVASRGALKKYLAGGGGPIRKGRNQVTETTEAALRDVREIQERRERQARGGNPYSKMPGDLEGTVENDDSDAERLYGSVVERDHSDWGIYTVTGAQRSAAEVEGILVLSDVYGTFDDGGKHTRRLCDRIADECKPCVVLAPDLFRSDPWSESYDSDDYETWRARHPIERVHADVRAAAALLVDRYGVDSVGLLGTCYGGGRALELALDPLIDPPPRACVAWYPTRYNPGALFGKDAAVSSSDSPREDAQVAVMAVFGSKDTLPGATPDDADRLETLLSEDPRVSDHMVEVFPGQTHGFAHRFTFNDKNDPPTYGEDVNEDSDTARARADAETVSILSTAFLETYTRVFLPTVGTSIAEEKSRRNQPRESYGYGDGKRRDVRAEIAEAEAAYDYDEYYEHSNLDDLYDYDDVGTTVW